MKQKGRSMRWRLQLNYRFHQDNPIESTDTGHIQLDMKKSICRLLLFLGFGVFQVFSLCWEYLPLLSFLGSCSLLLIAWRFMAARSDQSPLFGQFRTCQSVLALTSTRSCAIFHFMKYSDQVESCAHIVLVTNHLSQIDLFSQISPSVIINLEVLIILLYSNLIDFLVVNIIFRFY